MAADLSKTAQARDIHGDIVAKMLTKMSWRFRCGDYYIERTEGSKDITIVHTRIAKIYDVSVVCCPGDDVGAVPAIHGNSLAFGGWLAQSLRASNFASHLHIPVDMVV